MQIILNYLWVIPVIIAAICNAVMDTCDDHFSSSIFNDAKYKRIFWDKIVSWRNKYIDGDPLKGERNIFVWFTDSWHLFKSLMIVMQAVALMLAAMYYQPIYTYFEAIIMYGLAWNLTFNLFYNKILKR